MQNQAVIKKIENSSTKVHNRYVQCTYVAVVLHQYALMPKFLSLLTTLFFDQSRRYRYFSCVLFALLAFLQKNVKMSFALIAANKSSVESLYISVWIFQEAGSHPQTWPPRESVCVVFVGTVSTSLSIQLLFLIALVNWVTILNISKIIFSLSQ